MGRSFLGKRKEEGEHGAAVQDLRLNGTQRGNWPQKIRQRGPHHSGLWSHVEDLGDQWDLDEVFGAVEEGDTSNVTVIWGDRQGGGPRSRGINDDQRQEGWTVTRGRGPRSSQDFWQLTG